MNTFKLLQIYAYKWARDIGNQDIMIGRITESKYAYGWAKPIDNRDIMKPRVTESYWNDRFPGDKIK